MAKKTEVLPPRLLPETRVHAPEVQVVAEDSRTHTRTRRKDVDSGRTKLELPPQDNPKHTQPKNTLNTQIELRAGTVILGAAQSPRIFPWLKNPDGPRTVEQAVRIAKSYGVHIPEDVRFFAMDEYVPKNCEATYLQIAAATKDDFIEWREFYGIKGFIPVKIRSSVLESDEAILAVFAHEMYELNALRDLFEKAGGSIGAPQLHRLISPGFKGNLHDRAWDESDEKVAQMRKEKAARGEKATHG